MLNEPKYLSIKNDLQQNIIEGKFPLDSRIPSEAELRKVYDVSRHTIRQAIAELVNDGYLMKRQGAGTFVSNGYIKNLNEDSIKTIGVITTYLSDYIFPSIIRGIEEELSNRQYSLLLSSTQNNVVNEKESLEKMLEHNIDGLIIEPTKSNILNPNLNYFLKFAEKRIPMVMLNASYDELSAPVIAMDDVEAGKLATQHLIDLGHTKIVIITKMDDLQGKNRLKGYVSALYDSKLSFDNNDIITYDTESKDLLEEKIIESLTQENPPTAFVCYNDQIAIKLIHQIHAIGKSVPDDFSVVSHDDSFLSTTLPFAKLTTVSHPKEKLGKEAANWIVNAIEDKDFDRQSIIFHPELIVRDSTKSLIKEKLK